MVVIDIDLLQFDNERRKQMIGIEIIYSCCTKNYVVNKNQCFNEVNSDMISLFL